MGNAWKKLGATAPAKLANAYLQPYQLAQWLARFARGYLPAKSDDSHTSLLWRRNMGLMTTDVLEASGRQIVYGLDVRDLTLVEFVNGESADAISMHGRKDEEAGIWMRNRLEAIGLDGAALNAPAPYELPESPYSKGGDYDAFKDLAALSEFNRYLDNASLILSEVVDEHRGLSPGPAPVRLWPHHFDLATVITLEEGDFETARAIGVGLAIPDKLHKEFYLYTYPWPRNERKDLPKLRSNCSHQYDGFFGAVQPMSKVVKAKDQEATARFFFEETIEVFIGLLRKEIAAK